MNVALGKGIPHKKVGLVRHLEMPAKSKQQGKSKKSVFTHFLCLPLVTPTSRPILERSLHQFKTELASVKSTPIAKVEQDASLKPTANADVFSARDGENLSSIIDGTAVRPVGTLHLTLGVMSFKEQGKIEEAVKLLEEIDIESMMVEAEHEQKHAMAEEGSTKEGNQEELAANTHKKSPVSQSALSISLRSLGSMHSPSKTSVLYTAPIDATNRTQPFCEQIRRVFQESGLMVKDDRPLKLHATIVNTIYVKGRAARDMNARGGKVKADTPEEGSDAPTGKEHGMTIKHNRAVSQGGVVTSKDNEGQELKEEDDEDELGRGVDDNDEDDKEKAKDTEDTTKKSKKHLRRRPGPIRFNARPALDHFKEYIFAEDIQLDRIAICEMGAKKVLDEKTGEVIEEAYREVAVRALPL